MNKKLLLSLLIGMISLCSIAQSTSEVRALNTSARADQVKAMKIGYLADKMKLTSDQSVAFWPIYNEYWKARFDLFEAKRATQEKINSGKATQADIDELIRVEADQATLMKQFAARFEKVISIDQVAKMFVAEENFKGVLLKSLK